MWLGGGTRVGGAKGNQRFGKAGLCRAWVRPGPCGVRERAAEWEGCKARVQFGDEGEGTRRKSGSRETVEERMSSELGQVETGRQMQKSRREDPEIT